MREIFPKLSWVGSKTFPQQNGGRKNEPGRADEHNEALQEAYAIRLEQQEKEATDEII